MDIKPLRKKVLLAENKSEATTEAGIIIEGARSVSTAKKATVLEIGSEVTLVNKGDIVILDWSKAQVVKVDGAQRVIVDEDNIVAVVDPE